MADSTSNPPRFDAGAALPALRILVGLGTWLAPGPSWRTFGLGPMHGNASAGLITRLFGVHDLALGLAARHPAVEVRRAALQIGVAVDSVDAVATLLAVRAGAPKPSLLGVGLGAALFTGLGLVALQGLEAPSEGAGRLGAC